MKEIKTNKYDKAKINGVHYTPDLLSEFVVKQIVEHLTLDSKKLAKICDPAVGDGALLLPLYLALKNKKIKTKVTAFDIDLESLNIFKSMLLKISDESNAQFLNEDFVQYFLRNQDQIQSSFDIVISNPPYVRTQVLGADLSKKLSKEFGFSGRVDLYFAFIEGIYRTLSEGGLTGIIVSNKFMKNNAGRDIRRRILEYFDILHIWDFGDTRLFKAAVLPVVLILRKKTNKAVSTIKPLYTTIYTTSEIDGDIKDCGTIFDIVKLQGKFKVGREIFDVRQGVLEYENVGDMWRLGNKSDSEWINLVEQSTWKSFDDVSEIRVGVKTTADNVFIRKDWESLASLPEVLRPLITHHIAKRFRVSQIPIYKILYTHEIIAGKKTAIKLQAYPNTEKYLRLHFNQLNSRTYIQKSNRNWYEIWVPQDPSEWVKPKLIFRDIAKEPTFWLDLTGSIVNGDCYWITLKSGYSEDILWLQLAVSNSSFIERFYDLKFDNKLYSGRRRFMTQYVKKFPIPDPNTTTSRRIIELTKLIYKDIESSSKIVMELNSLIPIAFNVN